MPNTTGIMLAAVCLGGTIMAITALGFMGARTLSSSDPRRIFALMTAAFGLGQIVGPTIAGWLFDRTGSFLLPSMMAVGALVIAAMLGGGADPKLIRTAGEPRPAA